jgi:hypothetical protein
LVTRLREDAEEAEELKEIERLEERLNETILGIERQTLN